MNVFISPPFGNYTRFIKILQTSTSSTLIPIIGSYTLKPRKGLLKNIVMSVRYNYIEQGWVNKIGLRNAGIIEGLKQYNIVAAECDNVVLSVGVTDPLDIPSLLKLIPENINIEINISCPNINNLDEDIDELLDMGLGNFIVPDPNILRIIKVPHMPTLNYIDKLYDVGFRQFHCSNTKKIKQGGLSGPALRQKNLHTIEEMSRRYCGDIEIIGGGGIQTKQHIEQYKWAGASHVSISTVLTNPVRSYDLLRGL